MKPRKSNAKSLGNSGEELAAQFLLKKGYRILAKNYRTSRGEIDIVAQEKSTLCFVEVKTRARLSCGSPLESVNLAKQRKLSYMAYEYLSRAHQSSHKARFDVVAITILSGQSPEIKLIRNAFEVVE